jgi:hypothetical protein
MVCRPNPLIPWWPVKVIRRNANAKTMPPQPHPGHTKSSQRSGMLQRNGQTKRVWSTGEILTQSDCLWRYFTAALLGILNK